MAIAKQIAFEGLTYNLDDRDRVAASVNYQAGGFEKIALIKNHALATTAGDSIVQWTQPANTLIMDAWLLCTTAPVIGSGDIGYEIGTSSSGDEIAGVANEILDGGTTVVVGALTMIGGATGATLAVPGIKRDVQNDTTHVVDASYTTSARTLYLNLVNSQDATTNGAFTWIIKYLDFEQAVEIQVES